MLLNLAEKYKQQVVKAYQIVRFLKAHTNHWCPIVSSPELKKALLDRMTDLGVTPEEVVTRADVSWEVFKKYYIEMEEPNSRPALRPEDLRKVGEKIGILFKVTVILQDPDKVDRDKLLIDGFIPHNERKKNKSIS